MVKVTLKWSGLAAQDSIGGRSYTEVYQVSGVDSPLAACASRDETTGLAVPLKNQPHPYSTTANPLRVSNLSANSIGWQYYEVTVSYSRPEGSDQHPDEQNPLNQLPDITWGPAIVSEPIEFDIHKNPIVNAAGDALDPPPDEPRTVRTLTITQNEPFFNLDKSNEYANTVNTADWNPAIVRVLGTIKSGTMRCESITPASSYKPDAPYLPIVYSFEIDPLGWKRRFLNQGMNGYYSGGKLGVFCYADGTQVTGPVRLRKNGMPYDSTLRIYKKGVTNPADLPTPIPNPTPLPATVEVEETVYATWLIYETKTKKDWSNLGL